MELCTSLTTAINKSDVGAPRIYTNLFKRCENPAESQAATICDAMKFLSTRSTSDSLKGTNIPKVVWQDVDFVFPFLKHHGFSSTIFFLIPASVKLNDSGNPAVKDLFLSSINAETKCDFLRQWLSRFNLDADFRLGVLKKRISDKPTDPCYADYLPNPQMAPYNNAFMARAGQVDPRLMKRQKLQFKDDQGKVVLEMSIENGLLDGPYVYWGSNEHGTVRIENTYRKGVLNGRHSWTDQNGNILEQCDYKDGVCTNPKSVYEPNKDKK